MCWSMVSPLVLEVLHVLYITPPPPSRYCMILLTLTAGDLPSANPTSQVKMGVHILFTNRGETKEGGIKKEE